MAGSRRATVWGWLIAAGVLALASAPAVPLAAMALTSFSGQPVWTQSFTHTLGTSLLLGFGVAVTSLAVGLWLSAMNVQFRDVRYTIPFLIQFWLFATPIAYPSSLLSGIWKTVYGINPMVGVVEGFRWALLDTETAPGAMVLVSSLAAVGLLIGGAYYFRRMERTFADVV